MPFDGTPRAPSIEVISRAYANLVHPEEFFDSGRKCHRGELRDGHGSFCLIGSIDHVGCGDLTSDIWSGGPARGTSAVRSANRSSA